MDRLVDIHSHVHEFEEEELQEILARLGGVVIIGVGDDLESSRRVIELSKRYRQVAPCVGLHPWSVKNKDSVEDAKRIIELALENGVRCFGEVGLDTKFVPETIEAQRSVFKVFLEAARDNGILLNLHTAGTWEEVFNLLVRYDIDAANFHWYTGPQHLLREIEEHGYTISINPAIRIQKKHQAIVREAPLEIMLTESDSPYEYRGMRLTPLMIRDVISKIAELKGLSEEDVKRIIWGNFEKKYLKFFYTWVLEV